MKKLVYLIPLLIIPLVFVFFKLKKEDRYYSVEERELKKVVYASGVVRPPDYVVVRPQVSGYVKKVLVKENDRVRKGQLMAIIDDGGLTYAYEEALSQKALVDGRLREDSDYLRALREDMDRAQLRLEQERRHLERRERLFQRGLIPREQYENAKTTYELALKEYQKAQAVYKDTLSSLRKESQRLQAQVNRLKEELRKYEVRSPTDGLVLKKYVNVGDYVNPVGQDVKLFTVGNTQSWEVLLDVDEEFLSLVKEGDRVYLVLDVYPDKGFEGRVERVIRDVDRSRRVFQVKVKADLPPDTPANATVEANIVVYEKKALVIPKEAYRDRKVIKFDGVRLLEVPVKVGVEVDGYLEVLEGLKAGDRVKLP